MNKKRALRAEVTRHVIQVVFFILAPGLYAGAFSGVKYIFTQVGAGAMIEKNSFMVTLVLLCVFTMIFGRYFCGYACAFGTLGDYVFLLRKGFEKLIKKKLPKIPQKAGKALDYLKYIILLAIIAACFAGVYDKARGYSPWDVFSMLRALKPRLEGYGLGVGLMIAILVGMVFRERFFCRFLCPMGAVFSLLPMNPFFTIRSDRKKCLPKCRSCINNCPANLQVGDDRTQQDCFQCGQCVNKCPKKHITSGFGGKAPDESGFSGAKGDEPWWMIGRGVLLAGLWAYFLGI